MEEGKEIPRHIGELLQQVRDNKFSAAAIISKIPFQELLDHLDLLAEALMQSLTGDFSSGNLYTVKDCCQVIRTKLGFKDLAAHSGAFVLLGSALANARFPRSSGLRMSSGDFVCGNASSYFLLMDECAQGGDLALKNQVVEIVLKVLNICSTSKTFEQALKPAAEVLTKHAEASSASNKAIIELFKVCSASRSTLLAVLGVTVKFNPDPVLAEIDVLLEPVERSPQDMKTAQKLLIDLIRIFPDVRAKPVITKLSSLIRKPNLQEAVFQVLAVASEQEKLMEHRSLDPVLETIKKESFEFKSFNGIKNVSSLMKLYCLLSPEHARRGLELLAYLGKGMTGKHALEILHCLKSLVPNPKFDKSALSVIEPLVKKWASDRDRMIKYDAQDVIAMQEGTYVKPEVKEIKKPSNDLFFFGPSSTPAAQASRRSSIEAVASTETIGASLRASQEPVELKAQESHFESIPAGLESSFASRQEIEPTLVGEEPSAEPIPANVSAEAH